MKNIAIFALILAGVAAQAPAQLTPYQRQQDFQQLAALYDKNYSFLEWKRDQFGFDLLNLAPWLDKISKVQSDVEFFELCEQYVASLQDSHSVFFLSSDFTAQLGFYVDIYDGRYMIDLVDRTVLSARRYPFAVGDELISIDGVPAADIAAQLSPLVGAANPRSALRFAAYSITVRQGAIHPRSGNLPDTASVVVKRSATGALETYTIPWLKDGNLYTAGPVPDPVLMAHATKPEAKRPSWREFLRQIRTMKVINNRLPDTAQVSDSVSPYFKLPADFTVHQGTGDFDTVYSGVYKSGNYKIGYLRIPDFEYTSFDVPTEAEWLNANSDGLVIDLMGNPGGSGCDAQDAISAVYPSTYQSMLFKFRVTWNDLLGVKQYYAQVLADPTATSDDITYYKLLLDTFQTAYDKSRGLSDAIPICGYTSTVQPMTDQKGKVVAYNKPFIVLTDDNSASAAEVFAATVQDNGLAQIYGYRTNGAGGSVQGYYAGTYMEANANITHGIMVRSRLQTFPGFPTTPYVENLGVQPDINVDYMTIDNLNNQGKSFFDGFTSALITAIQKATKPTTTPDPTSQDQD